MGSTREVIWIQKESPCPYKPGELRRVFVLRSIIPGERRQALYREFVSQGFLARSTMVVGNNCNTCNSCVPLRVNLENYTMRKKEKSLFLHNAHLRVSHSLRNQTINVNNEHLALYRKHALLRHNDNNIYHAPENDLRLELDGHSGLMEIRSDKGPLLAVMIYDDLGNGLNAHYSFYDPHKSTGNTSLGTYSILKLMEHAVSLGMKYLYLGSWVDGNAKLAYKSQFNNLEALTPNGWVPFDPAQHKTGPDYKTSIPPGSPQKIKGP